MHQLPCQDQPVHITIPQFQPNRQLRIKNGRTPKLPQSSTPPRRLHHLNPTRRHPTPDRPQTHRQRPPKTDRSGKQLRRLPHQRRRRQQRRANPRQRHQDRVQGPLGERRAHRLRVPDRDQLPQRSDRGRRAEVHDRDPVEESGFSECWSRECGL